MTDPDLDGLVNDYLDTCANIEKHTTRKEQLADQLIQRIGVGGRHETMPGVGVRIQAGGTWFDPAKAARILTAEQLAAISEAKPVGALAKKFLPGLLVEQCKGEPGKPSVRQL